MIRESLKKSSKNFALVALLIAGSFILSACSISTNSTDTGVDSSVFLSTDGGSSWREAVNLAGTGEVKTIRNVNVNVMTFDPQDNLAVYLATRADGLYYTYNVALNGWIKVDGLPNTLVNDVEVDPVNKCIIYTAISNRLYKSVDCSRNFEEVYYDNNLEVSVKDIAIDHYNPNNIYIGTSRGEIIKSIDGGATWRTIHRLNDGVSQLILSPVDSRLAFVATTKNQIFSFTVSSTTSANDPIALERSFAIANFTDLNPVLKE